MISKKILENSRKRHKSRPYSSKIRPLKNAEQKYKKKNEKLICVQAISQILGETCCNQQCGFKFQIVDILKIRESIISNNEVERSNYILEILKVTDGKPTIKNILVCNVFFTKAYFISYGKYLNIKNAFEKNCLDIIHGNIARVYNNNQEQICRNWICVYVESAYVQYMPGANGTTVIEYPEWNQLYSQFVEEMKKGA